MIENLVGMRTAHMMDDKISHGVSKLNEWKGSSVWYRINCSCGGDCDTDMEFEFDKDFGFINLNFYKNVAWSDYDSHTFFGRIWSRLKAAYKILTTGYISLNGSTLIQEEGHINSVIEALQEGRDKLIKFKADFDKLKGNKNED